MNAHDDEQTELLRQIWNQIKQLDRNLGHKIDQTNERLDQTNERLDQTREELGARIDQVRVDLSARIDQTNERIDQTNERLDQTIERLDHTNLRIDDLALDVRALRAATQVGFETLARGGARQDERIEELRTRIERVESHVGLR